MRNVDPIADSSTLLKLRVAEWAIRIKKSPRIVRVQEMSRKWGSCSTTGIITLASDLCSKDRQFQDFVIVHELLHLRVKNHGRLFKSYMAIYLPNWEKIAQEHRVSIPHRTKKGFLKLNTPFRKDSLKQMMEGGK